MWTKRTVATVAVAGMVAAGVTGVAVAAGNGDQTRVQERIQTWVDEGAITQEDAEAFARVQEQAQTEREERRAERQQQREEHLAAIAEAAGVTPEQLQERRRNGETLSEIAGDNADAVAELLTTQMQERLAQAEAAIPERVDALMNREGGQRGPGFDHDGLRGEGFGPGHEGGFGPGPEGGFGPGPTADSDDA